MPPATKLPPVRELAAALEVSPATVAAAYRALRQRGFVVADRGRGTSVAPLPPVRVQPVAELPAGVRDLASGNPDPALLPALGEVLARLDPAHRLYGLPAKLPELEARARADFAADGIDGDVAVTGGALDAIERALQTELRAGDRVVVEDPSWPRIADLVHALGFALEPVPVDERGLVPDALGDGLRRGARAVIATPRGQNPTGAAADPERGSELRAVLARHRDVLVLEDDYVARVVGAPYVPLHDADGRWAVIRSLSKVLGPDLRVAVVAGDPLTISRIEGRQRLGPGWVSHVLQQVAALLLRDRATARLLARAEQDVRGASCCARVGACRAGRRGGRRLGPGRLGAACRRGGRRPRAARRGLGGRARRAVPLPQRPRDPRHHGRARAGRGRAPRRGDRGARPRARHDLRRLTEMSD